MEKDYILNLKGITKVFPGVRALDNVDFNVERGTIHGLVGENGAGKSTLIKVLSGIYEYDEGEIILNGERRKFNAPIEARRAGISVVHQEIKLSETLSVTENLFLGNLLMKGKLVDWKEMRKRAQEIVDKLGMDIDIYADVSTLSVAKKQIVEIMHAINNGSDILIMDEPSAVLTDRELEIMFDIVKKLNVAGITIIYISHRLHEVFDLTHNVTVLRDGEHIGTLPTSELDQDKLISMMVGREMGRDFPKEDLPIGETTLEINNLNIDGVLNDISFKVQAGEIFGISGLVGSGRTELARAIVAIDKIDSGERIVKGEKVKFNNFADAIEHGIGLVPEDRKLQGLIQIMSVKKNITLVNLDEISRNGILNNKLEKESADEFSKKLSVATPSLETEVQYLSGGNQQKVVIAKWLFKNADILFLDEPTRGIDVGAKEEIYRLISNLARDGKTVIMISSEMPELIGMCDRIMVMHEGEKKGELIRGEFSQEKIMSMCV